MFGTERNAFLNVALQFERPYSITTEDTQELVLYPTDQVK
jgi:hypothetical protein